MNKQMERWDLPKIMLSIILVAMVTLFRQYKQWKKKSLYTINPELQLNNVAFAPSLKVAVLLSFQQADFC